MGRLWVKENTDYCGATKQYKRYSWGCKTQGRTKGLDGKETKAEVIRGVCVWVLRRSYLPGTVCHPGVTKPRSEMALESQECSRVALMLSWLLPRTPSPTNCSWKWYNMDNSMIKMLTVVFVLQKIMSASPSWWNATLVCGHLWLQSVISHLGIPWFCLPCKDGFVKESLHLQVESLKSHSPLAYLQHSTHYTLTHNCLITAIVLARAVGSGGQGPSGTSTEPVQKILWAVNESCHLPI